MYSSIITARSLLIPYASLRLRLGCRFRNPIHHFLPGQPFQNDVGLWSSTIVAWTVFINPWAFMGIQISLGLCTISQDVPLLIQTTVCGPIFLVSLETRSWILSCTVERGTPYILLAHNIVDVPFLTSIKAYFRDSFEYFCMRLFSLVNILLNLFFFYQNQF